MSVLLTSIVGTRRVEQPKYVSVGIGFGCRHAAQMSVAAKIMFPTIYRNRLLSDCGEPKCVCSALMLVPHTTGDNSSSGIAVSKVLVADRVEDDTLCVAKCDHKI